MDLWLFYSMIYSSLLLFIFWFKLSQISLLEIPLNLFLSIFPIICFKHLHPLWQREMFHFHLILFLKSANSSEPFHFYCRMVFRNQNTGPSYVHCYCGVNLLGLLSGNTQTPRTISILILCSFLCIC